MRQWIIKRFRKKKAVRLYIINENRRVHHYWTIPIDGNVTIGGTSFKLTKDDYLLKDNIPTYFFNYKSAGPLNLYENSKVILTPEDFNLAIDTHVARDIFMATMKSKISPDTLIILGAMAVGFLAVGYFLNDKLDAINRTLEALGIGG